VMGWGRALGLWRLFKLVFRAGVLIEMLHDSVFYD
jgi:hypothetical protein